ncbi:sugar ABC transporter permease [Streptomyces sp. ME01-24h]|nr:sugar ABC transporter permease [Streptomyces sp. ME19-03-3]MDX3352397.1 sugar ABC transporter permease [Streptomyces sp. ME01-24h]
MTLSTSSATAPARHEALTGDRRADTARRSAARRETGAAYGFLAPYLLLFLAFVIAPVVLGLWMSLHDWDLTLPLHPWSGLRNYTDLLSGDSAVRHDFWQSMRAAGIFTVLSVPLLIAVPLAVALVMNGRFPGRNAFRAVYFAPYVLGVAVISICWRYLLDSNIGVLNHYLGALGLPDDIAWTTSVPAAWFALVGVTVWWTLGFNAVILLAGLQDIPGELYEAARLDGAGAWQRFRNITLPGLRPVLQFVSVNTLIASANMYGQSLLITGGAPGNETRTAIVYIADTGLRNFDAGRATAMSFTLTVCLGLLSAGVFLLLRNRES